MTLFRAIIVLCRTNNIMWNIPHIWFECEEYYVGLTMFCRIFLTFSLNVKIFCRILSIPYNIVMALNNVMSDLGKVFIWEGGCIKLFKFGSNKYRSTRCAATPYQSVQKLLHVTFWGVGLSEFDFNNIDWHLKNIYVWDFFSQF